jgi:tetratricopeptide (TPR) repeat protein
MNQAQRLLKNSGMVWFMQGLLTLEHPLENDENHWATAATQFDQSSLGRSDVVSALYNSALCQFLMGFRDTSSQLLQAAVDRDPSIGPAYYLIGFGHAVAKRFDEALKAWTIAAQFEPLNPDVHANLAALHYRKGDFAAASRNYMQAHRLLPQDAGILAALGLSFAQQKLYNQAITALEQSIAFDPRSALAHSNLGLAYYLFKQVEKALHEWRLVSKIDVKYAASREEEQQRSFDDSIVQLRPISWRNRVIHLAPVLPSPQTRLLPGSNAQAFRPAITDATLVPIVQQKREVRRASRLLAWMALKI